MPCLCVANGFSECARAFALWQGRPMTMKGMDYVIARDDTVLSQKPMPAYQPKKIKQYEHRIYQNPTSLVAEIVSGGWQVLFFLEGSAPS